MNPIYRILVGLMLALCFWGLVVTQGEKFVIALFALAMLWACIAACVAIKQAK
jgi:hypothetical protein